MKKIILILGVLLLSGCSEFQYKPEIIIKSEICEVGDNSNYSHMCEMPCDGDIFEEAFKCQNNELEIIKEIKTMNEIDEFMLRTVDEFVTEDLKYKINIDCRDLQENIDYKYIQENQNDEFITDFINPIFELCKNTFPKLFIEKPILNVLFCEEYKEKYDVKIECNSSTTGLDLLIEECDDLLCLGEGYYG